MRDDAPVALEAGGKGGGGGGEEMLSPQSKDHAEQHYMPPEQVVRSNNQPHRHFIASRSLNLHLQMPQPLKRGWPACMR
jgi:hypothetical protein